MLVMPDMQEVPSISSHVFWWKETRKDRRFALKVMKMLRDVESFAQRRTEVRV